jgi:hypothetical protein
VLAAGCSGEEPAAQPPETMSPSTSPVATTSPSPTPEAPELPAAARENTKAGAVAFAHHYIDVVNYVRRGGSVQKLLRLSSTTCESCDAIVQVAADTYSRGGYIRGGDWTVRGTSAFPAGNSSVWQVVTELQVAKQTYQPREGAEVERRRSERATLVFTIERPRSTWTVATLERQSNG